MVLNITSKKKIKDERVMMSMVQNRRGYKQWKMMMVTRGILSLSLRLTLRAGLQQLETLIETSVPRGSTKFDTSLNSADATELVHDTNDQRQKLSQSKRFFGTPPTDTDTSVVGNFLL